MEKNLTPIEPGVLADAEELWNYHRLAIPYDVADVILGLGSYDLSVAKFAAELFLQGRSKWLFFAGGSVPRTDLLQTPWASPEAEVFGAEARAMGVPSDAIVLEPHSSNTSENFRFSFEEMRRRGIKCKRLIVVTKPNMERRARATAGANVPRATEVSITSPPTTFARYCESFDVRKLIHLMVGDLQRIDLYPSLGFQSPEIVPEPVRAAYQRLLDAGFTGHLLTHQSTKETLS
jgi:uncharacterized SAM-binding protein YcdF (DUF218 family)